MLDGEHSEPKPNKRRWWPYWLIIILGTTGFLAFLMGAGYMTIVLKDPQQKVIVRTIVCGDKEIERANQFTTTDMTIDQFKSLVDEIKKKSGYASDPTCLNIAAQYYFMYSDIRSIEDTYNQIKELNDQDIYPNNKLDSYTTLNELNQFLINNSKSEN